MLQRGMYVRCPADYESQTDPRVFICAQVKEVNEFEEAVTVESYDPFRLKAFFDDLPIGKLRYPIESVKRCRLFIGSEVIFNGQAYEVLAVKSDEEGFNEYYLKDRSKPEPIVVMEADLVASLTNGDVDPAQQLREYEFQNPAWYVGRSIVSRSMNILDNSINGFKELAGSKIRLLPHQVNTVLRCLQETPCRFLLADEVGMGKTVEALSILKIFLRDNANTRTLIVVPATLKEQWRIELLLKFNLLDGENESSNFISIVTVDDLPSHNATIDPWDFVVIDEAHRYIGNRRNYDLIHRISQASRNVLLLSATPVQQRREEYLDLLRLLDPKKYDAYSIEQFGALLDLQGRIIQRTALILDDLDDYREELASADEEGSDPHDSEECEELFEEIRKRAENVDEIKKLKMLVKLPISAKNKIDMISAEMEKKLKTDEDYTVKITIRTQLLLDQYEDIYNDDLYKELAKIIRKGQKEGSVIKGDALYLADLYWGTVYLYALRKLFAPNCKMVSKETLSRLLEV